MEEQIITGIGLFFAVSVPTGLIIYLHRSSQKTFQDSSVQNQKDFQKSFKEIINPLTHELRENSKATNNLANRLTEMEISYPQRFADAGKTDQRFGVIENTQNEHGRQISVLNSKLDID